jgi:hypothetical protein
MSTCGVHFVPLSEVLPASTFLVCAQDDVLGDGDYGVYDVDESARLAPNTRQRVVIGHSFAVKVSIHLGFDDSTLAV